ncbi:ribosomal subunit interface protein [Candidatus Saccharibacteria bacterium CG11_big_fil_rev_8_21_14_0_20_41_19]|nr:ribosome-associated translation inhibitor RaiA [Candidatus Saccharibacteria bacterium]OIP85758.1 MAG: ribosomal subunit interface protein [Candidatus Saccharibacteria bacterium CG2_30_41_52]PIQ70874.1 MAG: ribosomal subunit interface protein [Candidatus Saccharibacteria bacterium CG11_big_fil_rev_8_21_14_0_20_41_19]PIZ61211.1 MAG: ribosomal subunit interface protein [Candidatus Saccharibacteria bacterium CG_4_10_14_0_2_um_filter_41_11]PJC29663.1 MAG: ribosomal subunit interface protein [Cand
MITSVQIVGIAYEIDENTRKYVIKRIGRLDRYLPRHARKTVSAEVKLEEVNHNHGNKYQVEVILNLPGKLVTAKDSTSNILAAVDIVEAKIQAQLRDYKQSAISHIGNRGVMSRIKRSFQREL